MSQLANVGTEELQSSFHAFNELSQQLADSYHDLEKHVSYLNQELAAARNERLQQMEEKDRLASRLKSLLDALPASVIVLNGKGEIQEFNPASIDLLGAPLQDELWAKVIERAFIEDAPVSHGLKLMDGRRVSFSTCPLGSEPGQILLLQDITETVHLQERLSQHQRLADMGKMAASLAHQIRTPLSSALLYTSQLCQVETTEDKRISFASKAVERLNDLEQLIHDMLMLTRGDAGETNNILAVNLLHSVIESMSETLKKSLTLFNIFDKSSGSVIKGNQVLLESALQNLVNNAVQAMGDGGTLNLFVRASGDESVDLVVEDNGPGMTAELQRKVFDPFETTRSNGTGLGLSVVHTIAEIHHGEVLLESNPGEGSRFSIRLPKINK